jgi:hypothetical protein
MSFVSVGLWQHYDSGTCVIDLWNQVTLRTFLSTGHCNLFRVQGCWMHELKGCTNDQWQLKCTITAVPNFLYPNWFMNMVLFTCADTAEFAWIFIAYWQRISTNENTFSHRRGKIYSLISYPFKACRLLNVPPGLTLKNSTWYSHHIAFKCSVWTFTLYKIKRLVLYNQGGECLLRGTDWVLT